MKFKYQKLLAASLLYGVAGWILIKVIGYFATLLSFPAWTDTAATLLFLVGFPIALWLAWVSENKLVKRDLGEKSSARPAPRPDKQKSRQPVSAGGPETEADSRPRYSVAVLPFNLFSRQAEDEHLADGLTEDIITALTANTTMSVTARNTTFKYKGTSPDIRAVGLDLMVLYVVEGSVRRMGQRLRITAQLIDSLNGDHLWADKYDCDAEDIFKIQDELTHRIALALASAISSAELRRMRESKPGDLEARDQSLSQLNYLARPSKTNLDLALKGIADVIESNPNLFHAHAIQGLLFTYRASWLLAEDPGEDLRLAKSALDKAQQLEFSEPGVMRNRSFLLSLSGDPGLALKLSEQVLKEIPDSTISLQSHGMVLAVLGKSEEALEYLREALRLAPQDAFAPAAMTWAALASLQLQQYEAALEYADQAVDQTPELPTLHLARALALAGLGREAEARASMKSLRRHAAKPTMGVIENGLRWYSGSRSTTGHLFDLFRTLWGKEEESRYLPTQPAPDQGARNAPGLPTLIIPNFRLLERLGEGGAGQVYLAEQQRPRRKVAVKIVSPDSVPAEFLKALKEEGDIAAQFEHDHLIIVIECGIVDGHYYMAMHYLAGGTLDNRIVGGLSPKETVPIVVAIASALEHIHDRGYVHRDIKPGNILFSAAGKPVLADFGIAKVVGTVGVMTRAGYVTGTPAYMSPEQILGNTLDGRSDLYSLGIVLFQCLMGQLPFSAESDFSLRKAHVELAAPRLPPALEQLQAILDRLLAKSPSDRFDNAAMLIQALQRLENLSIEAPQAFMPSSQKSQQETVPVPDLLQATKKVPKS